MADAVIMREDFGQTPTAERVTRAQTTHRGGRTAMDGTVCSVCGERNAPGAEFCVACNAFLGWDEVGGGQRSAADARSSAPPARDPDAPNTAATVRAPDQAHPERPKGRFLVTAEQDSVTLMPT